MYWLARKFDNLAGLPDERLFDELEAGLALVAQNALRLMDSAIALFDHGGPHQRSAGILGSHATDEAGKFLMLVDAARCPRNDLRAHLRRVGSHLPRLLYAETAKLWPATFGELRAFVARQRRSHYLDGAEGIEWVFRNSILYWREQALYVDRVEDEDGVARWQDPSHYDELLSFSPPSRSACDLVNDLFAVALHRAPALAVLAESWREFVPVDEVHVTELHQRTVATLATLESRGLLAGTPDIWQRIVERWTFPLWSLDTNEDRIRIESLRAERDRYEP